MDVKEAGKIGAQRTREKYGDEHYKEIGKKGGQKLAQERGSDYFKEIGKKGAKRLQEIIKAGKEAENADKS